MIKQLYTLKKTQTDQVLAQKAAIDSKISSVDDEIMFTQNKINVATVNKSGAISDFSILVMHKNSMKLHITKLNQRKYNLEYQSKSLLKKVIELQKESEQFLYILEEEKKDQIKKILAAEEEASSEYMQSKYNRV